MNMQEKESPPVVEAGIGPEELAGLERAAGGESFSSSVDRGAGATDTTLGQAGALAGAKPRRSRQLTEKKQAGRHIERPRKRWQDSGTVRNHHLAEWKRLPSAGPHADKENYSRIKAKCLKQLELVASD